jgi:uncharacterized membrane protein YczE
MEILKKTLKITWLSVGIVMGVVVGIGVIAIAGALGVLLAEALLRLLRVL